MENMKQDWFNYLPYEFLSDILSRLPPQTILSCKCVCKSLHDLVGTHEFAKLHLSKSVVSELAVVVGPNNINDKNIKLRNVQQHNNLVPDFHLSTITTLDFSQPISIEGSADRLLLLSTMKWVRNKLYLCNPITREYVNLHSHTQTFDYSERVPGYGFGVSRTTGQYKAVRICVDKQTYESDCKIYTIGTGGSWRSIAPQSYKYRCKRAIFVNGNLHWLVHNLSDKTPLISCFDLETELFTTFSPPPLLNRKTPTGVVLTALEDNLCLCDCTSNGVIIVWLMKEYGVDKSWTKKIVITDTVFTEIYPIRVFEDGVILMSYSHRSLKYYSSKNKTTQTIYDPQ